MVRIQKRQDGRWVKACSECGEEQDYLRKNYAEQSLRLNKTCKKCSNRKTENNHRGLYNLIRISWFNKCKTGAELRGLVFDITIEDVWFMYTSQDGRCALSGVPIGWSDVGSIHTASIDRIDSSKGYLKDNVQLLHKDVNFMKQQFSQEYFIEICKAVVDKVKW
jgi:hypothetical protein